GGVQPGTGGAGAGGTKSGTGGLGAGGGGTSGSQTGTGGAGVGGTKSGSGGSSSGGASGADGGKPDVLVSTDAGELAALCTSTGGLLGNGLCCMSATDFPNSCLDGACGCSPTNSHTIAVCTCPTGTCFTATTGCKPSAGGTGGSGGTVDASRDGNVACGSATCAAGEYCCNLASSLCAPVGVGCIQGGEDAAQSVDSNGCTARPEGDATMCGGSRPAHYYTCVLTMLGAPCAIVNIGSMTNSFCCP
ncbi:MAG TPA: hypothetical protein VIM14_00330, partial [Polyangia bacterium]